MSKKIELDVEGMTCGHCVRAVTNAIMGVEGVEGVSVDLESGLAVVVAEESVSPESLVAAIAEEEYAAVVRA